MIQQQQLIFWQHGSHFQILIWRLKNQRQKWRLNNSLFFFLIFFFYRGGNIKIKAWHHGLNIDVTHETVARDRDRFAHNTAGPNLLFKGAVCSFGGEIFFYQNTKIFFFLYTWTNKINTPLCFQVWIKWINKLKDKTVSYYSALFTCGGPCHLPSFIQCPLRTACSFTNREDTYFWVYTITSLIL